MAALISLTGCAGGTRQAEERHAGGALAERGEVEDGLQEGPWEFWYPNGTPRAAGSFRRDERDGAWTFHHPDGSLRMRGAYAGERQQGPWEFWYPGGKPQCRGEYHAGCERGEWTFWSDAGHVQQRGVFAGGQRWLRWQEFGSGGEVLAAGSYCDDVPVGRWQRLENGREMQFDYAMPPGLELVLETWQDGSVRREGFLRGGRAHGPWVTRHRGGALRAFALFADGEPVGDLLLFAQDGTSLARGPVLARRPAGRWIVRDGEALVARDVARMPAPPWDRRWSEAAVADERPPLQVAELWLAELCAPRETVPVAVPTEAPVATEAAIEPLLAPTDPGQWTMRERAELAIFRRYYRDGWLPRKHSAGSRYGAAADSSRLGNGDPEHVDAIVGKPLPHTSFPTADGKTLDLAAFRGKRVLFVVLRGFTTQVCVYCFAQTAELAPLAPRWQELACEVVVLFPGNRSRLQAFAAACADEFGDTPPPYHMVYDPDLRLATSLQLQGNLARPASFVLDRDGIVRHAYVAENVENVADRPAASQLLRWVQDTN